MPQHLPCDDLCQTQQEQLSGLVRFISQHCLDAGEVKPFDAHFSDEIHYMSIMCWFDAEQECHSLVVELGRTDSTEIARESFLSALVPTLEAWSISAVCVDHAEATVHAFMRRWRDFSGLPLVALETDD